MALKSRPQEGRVSCTRNPFKCQSTVAIPIFPTARKTTEVPSSNSCVLHVTGPSSQPWQVGSSWKKQGRMRLCDWKKKKERKREGRKEGNKPLRVAGFLSWNYRLISWSISLGLYPTLNSTISSHNLIPSSRKCQVKQPCKNRNALESHRPGFESEPCYRPAQWLRQVTLPLRA